MADAAVFGANSVDARRIAHQHTGTVFSWQQVIAIKALAGLGRDTDAIDAVVVVFEGANGRASRRVLVQSVAIVTDALVLQALAPHATSFVAHQQTFSVEHLEASIADARSVIATCSIVA